MLVWPFGADRTDLITDFFRAFDEQIAELGWLWEAGTGLGVAAWIPPGSDQVMMDIDRSMRSTTRCRRGSPRRDVGVDRRQLPA